MFDLFKKKEQIKIVEKTNEDIDIENMSKLIRSKTKEIILISEKLCEKGIYVFFSDGYREIDIDKHTEPIIRQYKKY